ncbi:MAG: hypothetical protein KDK39_07580 [Leptospiraceae bacterium]|nr:hypothetical protein [Leptospiraceae bacterium]
MDSDSPAELALDYFEEQIQSRLLLLQSGSSQKMLRYSSRYFKAGPFRQKPLRIFSPLKIKTKNHFCADTDYLAFQLSLLIKEQLPLHPDFLHQLLVVPELVTSHNWLLSHIYDPANKCLVLYLYPRRLNRSDDMPIRQLDAPQQNTDTAHYPDSWRLQLIQQSRPVAQSQDTMARIITQIPDLDQNCGLHYWFHPRNQIRMAELAELQDLHDQYQLYIPAAL